MAQEQVQQFIDQATQSIQGQRFSEALELLDQAIAIEPDNADATLLRAICLSQTGQPVAANDLFGRAISLAPTSAKAHFNFAVHLYAQGMKREALQEARAALELDPQHASARDLSTRIEAEFQQPVQGEYTAPPNNAAPGAPGGLPPQPFANQPPAVQPQQYYQQGYEAGPVHTIGFVEKLGKNWTLIGWGLAAISLLGLIFSILLYMPIFQMAMATAGSNPNANPAANQEQMVHQVRQSAFYIPAMMTFYGSWLLIVAYTIIDIIDRRGHFVWLLLQVPCTCCGCGFISMPLYMLLGRK